MNSTTLPIVSADFASESGQASHPALEDFTSLISGGIERRGFHIADADSLNALWSEDGITATEKLQRVHSFASAHGWEVAAKNKVTTVLFQPTGRRSVLPGMWRLCGMN